MNSIWKIRKQKILLKSFNTLRSVKDAELQVLVVLELVKDLNNIDNYIQFQGFLRLQAINTNSESLELDWLDLIKSGDTSNSDEEMEKQKMKINNFVISFINRALKYYPRSINLRILKSHFQFWETGTYWNSVYTLMKIPDLRPSIVEQCCSVCCSTQVEMKLMNMDEEEIKRSGFDIEKMISYRDRFLGFLRLINRTTKNHLEFWKELTDDNPDANKLLEIGDIITSRHETLNDTYKELSNGDTYNIKYHFIYTAFLRDVAHDEENCANLTEDMRFTKNIYTGYKTEEDMEADNMVVLKESCVIFVSGNRQIFGQVLAVCNQIKGMLGYNANEVVGQSIESVMPGYYAQKHEGLMKRFFESGKATVVNKNRIVFPKTKLGHIKHCKLRLRIMPNLEQGIRLVGVVTNVNKKDLGKVLMKKYFNLDLFYLVFNSKTGEIIGVSRSCEEYFGLSPSLFGKSSTNSPGMHLILPEIMQDENHNLLFGEGFETFIDTSMLMDNYFYVGEAENNGKKRKRKQGGKYAEDEDDNSSFNFAESSQNTENQKLERFQKCSIKAWVSDSSDYGDGEIFCLRFIQYSQEKGKFEAEVVEYETNLEGEKFPTGEQQSVKK